MTNYITGEFIGGKVALLVSETSAMIRIVRPRQRPIFVWFKECRHWCECLPTKPLDVCCECQVRPSLCVICKR